MVYLQPRAADSGQLRDIESSPSTNTSNPACQVHLNPFSHIPTIEACQQEAKTPYCWPPNGSRICVSDRIVPFYWPSNYYQDDSEIYISFGKRRTFGPYINDGNAYKTLQFDDASHLYGEDIPNKSEESIDITIIEHQRHINGTTQIVHAGPQLILDYTTSPSFSASIAARRVNPDSIKLTDWPAGKIMGVVFGSLFGLAMLIWTLHKCCHTGCWGCLLAPGASEVARVKKQEQRRIQAKRAARQPDVDAIKASVARGEVWDGSVRSGGTWVVDMPRRPSRAASRGSRASRAPDEIRPVGRAEHQDTRQEEQRVEQRRLEIARAEETEPPAYDAPPPKYTP
jgi:hypothetical protein